MRVLPIERILSEAAAQHVFQIAYHRDYMPWKLAYSRPCGVTKSFEAVDWKQIVRDFSEPEALLLHTCDTGGASSGSPMLLDGPDGLEVIGINVGTYEQSKVLMQDGQVKKRLKADTIANTAVASAAFAGRLEAFRAAAILATPAQMRELQGLLARAPALLGAGGWRLRRGAQDVDRDVREGGRAARDGARHDGAAAAPRWGHGDGAAEGAQGQGAAGEDVTLGLGHPLSRIRSIAASALGVLQQRIEALLLGG